jgi:hypothetical protein
MVFCLSTLCWRVRRLCLFVCCLIAGYRNSDVANILHIKILTITMQSLGGADQLSALLGLHEPASGDAGGAVESPIDTSLGPKPKHWTATVPQTAIRILQDYWLDADLFVLLPLLPFTHLSWFSASCPERFRRRVEGIL